MAGVRCSCPQRLARGDQGPVRGLMFLPEAEPSERINREAIAENVSCIGLEAARR
ncbi:MAG: hypothetical protein HYS13_07590 [Planctomycetia bacterium]|nr:hypothetical protein [Planctomycetia bacterium]